MGICHPRIEAVCDECLESVEYDLTETARGFDTRHLDDEMKDDGWHYHDGRWLCDSCYSERNDAPADGIPPREC